MAARVVVLARPRYDVLPDGEARLKRNDTSSSRRDAKLVFISGDKSSPFGVDDDASPVSIFNQS